MSIQEVDETHDQICGRNYTIRQPTKPKSFTGTHANKPRARFLVDGVSNSKGQIRFKSREGAERHIRNVGLSLE